MSETIFKAHEKYSRFKARFGLVNSTLLVKRKDKVDEAISNLKKQIDDLAKKEGLHLRELDQQYNDLTNAAVDSFNIEDAEKCREELGKVKKLARKAAEASVTTVSDFLKQWIIVEDQRPKVLYFVKIAAGVKAGDRLEFLVKPTERMKAAMEKVEAIKIIDAQAAQKHWNDEWGFFEQKAVNIYREEVLEEPLARQSDDLKKAKPNGPEAKMQEAFGETIYVQNLGKMKLTALSNGVDIDKLGISLGQALAISQYTSGAYVDINGILLGIPSDTRKPERVKQCGITTDVLKGAMADLKSWTKWPVMRGERKFDGWNKQYTKNNVFSLKAFWSTGLDFNFAGEIQITINGKTGGSAGKNVSALSQHPNENEILFPPGTKFRVISCKEEGNTTFVVLAEA
jgi:rubrerythrin